MTSFLAAAAFVFLSSSASVQSSTVCGDQAVSVQDHYGRSVTLAFRSGRSAWIVNLEKVDDKVDAAKTLPKLRALAKHVAGPRK